MEYLPNSRKSKLEAEARRKELSTRESRVSKTVEGGKIRKNEGRKFLSLIFTEDPANVGVYIIKDVVAPAVKKLMMDIITNGADRFLYGENGGDSKRHKTNKISYSNFYDNRYGNRSSTKSDSPSTSSRFDYDDIVYGSRGECEQVLDIMDEIMDRYKVVTVGDLYEISKLKPPSTSYSYGWTNISSAEPQRVRDGYIIKMPKAMPID